MKHVEIDRTTDAPTLEPAKQLLWDAAAEMERRGHCQGIPDGPRGEVCFISSLWAAQASRGLDEELPEQQLARECAIRVMRKHIGNHCSCVNFSDNNDQATVIAAMRAAALS